jgi:uncharacterized membrane-anchored protein YhcB (DUF1043 family)
MDAEKLGWYLYNDMTSGPVFGSIILDENGNETDKWVVKERDGLYPNITVNGWKSEDLIYDDGSGKSIPINLVIQRLRENFNKNNWTSVVNMIKTNTDYTPNSPSDSNNGEVKRLPNEHIPSSVNNYIPYSPISNEISPFAKADYDLAKPLADASVALPVLIQNVSNQLIDVQNKMNSYAQNTVATNITKAASNVSNLTSNVTNNAQYLVNTAQTALNDAKNTTTNIAQNFSNNASVFADNVGNKVMDFVEGDKSIVSVLTDIVSEPNKNTDELENKDEIKKIIL